MKAKKKMSFLMKRWTILLPVCLLCLNCYGQWTKFSKDGKVTALTVGDDRTIVYDKAALDSMNADARKTITEGLQKKIEETLTAMTDTNGTAALFYFSIWGADTGKTIQQELKDLRSLLDQQNVAGFDNVYRTQKYKFLEQAVITIKDSIYHSNTYTVNASKPGKAVLTRKYLYNSFQIGLFNATIKKFGSRNDLSPAHYSEVVEVLKKNKKEIDELAASYRASYIEGKPYKIYCKIKASKDHPDQQLNEVANIISTDPWFKEWFWVRGGVLKLNPLDLTTDAYIKKNPQYDVMRADMFNRYIDSLLERYTRKDTTQRVDEFKKLLAQRNSGKELYSDKARTDSLIAASQATLNELLTTQADLNIVEVPTKGCYYSFSADPEIKFDNDERAMKKALHTEETKTIVVHNIGLKAKAGLQETDKAIPDRSAVQTITDSVASYGGQIAKIVLDMSPYTGWLSSASFMGRSNSVITASSGSSPIGVASGGDRRYFVKISSGKKKATEIDLYEQEDVQEVIDVLKAALREKCAFDEQLFEKHFGRLTIEQAKEDLKKRMEQYTNEFDSLLLRRLVADSIRTAYFVDVYAASTPPPVKKLETKKAQGSQYRSAIMDTKPSDDPIKKAVAVYVEKEKDKDKGTDTVWLKKFSYKVGKNYHYQLSAGIAYTFQNYSQAKADVNNGQVTVTNTVQQYRFVAGLHLYPGKGLYLQDDRFIGKPSERYSIYLGVGIPDPLGNVYAGLAYDLCPGLKMTLGGHIVKDTRYVIQNSAIIESRLHYKPAGIFLALQIDPTSLINTLNVFKK